MKLNISQKLLLLFLLLAGVLVGLISTVTNYNISSGFTDYVNKTELESIDVMPQVLVNEFKSLKSWKAVFAQDNFMSNLLAYNERIHNPNMLSPGPPETVPGRDRSGGFPAFAPPPPDRSSPLEFGGEDRMPPSGPGGFALRAQEDEENRPWSARGRPPDPDGRGNPPPYPPFRVELFRRIGVFDQSGNLLWGSAKAKGSQANIPLILDGKEIGSLSLAPGETLVRELDAAFLAEQSRSLIWVSVLAIVLAGFAASILSRDFVGAIDELLQGTRKLTAGDFSVRMELARSDELGQLARDFNTLASALAQHERAHKQWLADTSHELRTPVAVLWAQVEALQDGIQEANPRTLAVLHEEVKNLAKMIDDLHDLARYDVDALNLRFLPTDIGIILHELLASFQERFEKKKIRVDSHAVSELHCIVRADAQKLRQVLLNLLENSLRYTDEGGQVQLSYSKDAKFLSLLFDDSHPGVPEELLMSIFDRFYRIESSRSRAHGGSGLGLAICKTIVDGHKGSIRALVSPLGGLRVELKLPLAEVDENG